MSELETKRIRPGPGIRKNIDSASWYLRQGVENLEWASQKLEEALEKAQKMQVNRAMSTTDRRMAALEIASAIAIAQRELESASKNQIRARGFLWNLHANPDNSKESIDELIDK